MMATMTMTMVWAIILFWCAMMGVVVRGSAEAERLTSTVCPSLRWGTYPAQLDLYYFYLIEFNNATTPDLQGIERAIAVRLVDMLEYKGCNVYGEPVIAMELNEKGHRYSSGGESSPQSFASTGICSSATPQDECRVVRGLTSVLLDTSADGVADLAYEVVVEVLADLPALNEYLETPLLHAEFVRRIGENLVLQPSEGRDENEDDSHGSSNGAFPKIAIVSAVTAFVLSGIFFLGINRKQQDKEKKETDKMRLAYYQAKRRKFWSQLQEDEDTHTYPGLMMTEPAPMQTVTWSVSDLTSESASIKSALKMDRIDEECEGASNGSHAGDLEADFDELYEEVKEDEEEISKQSSLPRPSLETPTPLLLENPAFIAHWREGDDDDSEPSIVEDADLSGDIWEFARLPKSYWDVSDPEAPTPDHSPASYQESLNRSYLHDYEVDDDSFADRQLDFSIDSPSAKQLPAVTYTTEEEDFSEASMSPATTNRQSQGSNGLNQGKSGQGSEKSIGSDPLAEESVSTSLGRLEDQSPMSPDDFIPNTPQVALDKSGMSDPDRTIPNMTTTAGLLNNPAVSMDEESHRDGDTPESSLSNADSSEDEEEVGDDSFSSASIKTMPTIGKSDVFYTPKQDAAADNETTLESVAKSIIREADIYDAATQRWAQRILEEITSPKPKLLAATPHNY